ncbi:MAG: FtsW/RodA/SpoVE family cell cycle protein [Clostridia bacterium]|nr:FtsW/RodA/SpoVE family cell cycle protein [Clostridia bacterium]
MFLQIVKVLNFLSRYLLVIIAYVFLINIIIRSKREDQYFKYLISGSDDEQNQYSGEDDEEDEEYYGIQSKWDLLFLIIIFNIISFLILALKHSPTDKKTLIFCALLCGAHIFCYVVLTVLFKYMDKYILLIYQFLTNIGLVMLYRLNYDLAFKQLEHFIVAIAVFAAGYAAFKTFKTAYKYGMFYVIVSIVLLIATLIFGSEKGGAKNWIIVNGYGFQPSEVIKLLIVLAVSSFVTKYHSFKKLLPAFVFIAFTILISLFQRDLGSALLYFLISLIIVYTSTSNIIYLLGSGAFITLGSIISFYLFSHVRRRVYAWRNPWADASGGGYQIIQSLIAIAWGGFFGTGYGRGFPHYIPVVTTDFIFSAICEEFGVLTVIAIIMMYLYFIIRGLNLAAKVENKFNSLVAVGIVSTIGIQAFVIIGGVTKLIPLTGITLPFISYGGSSFIVTSGFMGILENIYSSNHRAMLTERKVYLADRGSEG